MILPTWQECSDKDDCEQVELDPLEQFIFDYEPSPLRGPLDKEFREKLLAAIGFVSPQELTITCMTKEEKKAICIQILQEMLDKDPAEMLCLLARLMAGLAKKSCADVT